MINLIYTIMNATQRNATQRNATQRNATQRNATQRISENLFKIIFSRSQLCVFYNINLFKQISLYFL